MTVTVAALIYKDTRWIDYLVRGLSQAKNKTQFNLLLVANDPTDEVASDPRVSFVFRNQNPSEYYINRVYRAWNESVRQSSTEFVCLINSDMFVSDFWLDELMRFADDRTIPTSLLVESGRINSAIPEFVTNFGTDVESFNYSEWVKFSSGVRQLGVTSPGRLYMPVVFNRDKFLSIGGYPEGNPPGTTGDRELFRRLTETGMEHKMCMGSVVYHVQEGEMRNE